MAVWPPEVAEIGGGHIASPPSGRYLLHRGKTLHASGLIVDELRLNTPTTTITHYLNGPGRAVSRVRASACPGDNVLLILKTAVYPQC